MLKSPAENNQLQQSFEESASGSKRKNLERSAEQIVEDFAQLIISDQDGYLSDDAKKNLASVLQPAMKRAKQRAERFGSEVESLQQLAISPQAGKDLDVLFLKQGQEQESANEDVVSNILGKRPRAEEIKEGEAEYQPNKAARLESEEQTKLLITKETALNEVTESLKVKKVETAKLPTSIKEFYQFWQSPSFKDESGNVIEGQSDETRAAFKTAFTKKLDEDFEKITNYFSTKFTEAASLEVGSSSSQSLIFNTAGIKGSGFFSKNLQTFTDNKDQLLSLLHDYSAYIALLAEKIEGATAENKKSQIEKTRQFLRQFPPLSREEYQCLGGSSSRLSNALSVLQNSSIILLAHESLVNKAVSDFSNKVALGNHVHIKPMLHYFLGIDQKTISHIDHNYRTPIDSVNTQEVWQFVSSYQEKLNEEVAAEIAKAKNSFERETKEQKQNSQLPSSKDYEALAQKLTADHVIKIQGSDLIDEEKYAWKESADFEQLIKEKIKEQTQSNNQSNTDYFSTHLPSSTDITKPTTIKTIAQLAKDVDANKRQVAFSALRILGEELKDRNKNILQFLSILQEIGIEKNSEEKEIETNYENVLGIKRITNKAGGDEKYEVRAEDRKSQYLLSRIVDRCDRVLQDSGYHIGSVATGITSPNQQRQKDLLLFHSAITQGNQENTLKLITEHNNLINERNRFGETAIHIAAKYPESHPVLEILLANGADANGVTNNDWTPLHIAAYLGNDIIIQALLRFIKSQKEPEHKDYINEKLVKGFFKGWNAIHLATYEDKASSIKALKEEEVDIDAIISEGKAKGYKAVHIAAFKGKTNSIKALKEVGVDLSIKISEGRTKGFNAVHLAAANGQAEVIKFLKEAGVDMTLTVSDGSRKGYNALHLATICGKSQVIMDLIQAGIDISARVNDGDWRSYNALHIAANESQLEAIVTLVKAGIDPETKISEGNQKGYNAIHIAVLYCKVKAIVALIKAGSDINAKISDGDMKDCAAIHLATFWGENEVIEVLKSCGADLEARIGSGNERGWEGYNSIHLAAEKGKSEALKVLIKLGANPESRVSKGNGKGFDVSHLAAFHGQVEVIKALKLLDVNLETIVNEGTWKGRNSLHIAAYQGKDKVITALMECGVDFTKVINEGNAKGFNAFHLAAYEGKTESIKALMKGGVDLEAKISEGIWKGLNALQVAAKKGHINTINLLFSYYLKNENLFFDPKTKISPKTKGGKEKTLQQYLEENQDKEGFKTLLERIKKQNQAPSEQLSKASIANLVNATQNSR